MTGWKSIPAREEAKQIVKDLCAEGRLITGHWRLYGKHCAVGGLMVAALPAFGLERATSDDAASWVQERFGLGRPHLAILQAANDYDTNMSRRDVSAKITDPSRILAAMDEIPVTGS